MFTIICNLYSTEWTFGQKTWTFGQ